jgi:hypothetical protein
MRRSNQSVGGIKMSKNYMVNVNIYKQILVKDAEDEDDAVRIARDAAGFAANYEVSIEFEVSEDHLESMAKHADEVM